MRPFPWKCGTCGKRTVNPAVVDYTTEREHDGRAYSLRVPNLDIFECGECHARVLPDASREKVENALRAKAGLLTPQEIRDNRKAMGLNQEGLANYLRVAKETVSRWETGGQIQQRAMDLLLRVFFGVPQVRFWLDYPSGSSTIALQTIEPGTVTISQNLFVAGKTMVLMSGAPSKNITPKMPDQATKLVSFFDLVEKLNFMRLEPESGQVGASGFSFRVSAYWMREESDADTLFEVQFVWIVPNAPNEIELARGEFRFTGHFQRINLLKVQLTQFFGPGILRLEARIRRVGEQAWLHRMSYPILLEEIQASSPSNITTPVPTLPDS